MNHYDFIYNILNQKGVGRVKANAILQSCEHLFHSNSITPIQVDSILAKYFSEEQIFDIVNRRSDIKLKIETPNPFYINRFDKAFPESLKDLESNCPPIISCLGNKELLKNSKVGFCGSRKSSEKGLSVAKDIAQQVSNKQITVVSGYASGIDQETHYWALKEGGSTIIILPEGIANFKIKRYIKDVWDWERVLVISEFEPTAIWSVSRAMQRNTTIIALSDVMFLIEAKIKGGSIDAGKKTLQMNKKLFAPVYQDMPEEASGNQLLLSKGALPLFRKRETQRANLEKMFMYLTSDRKRNLFD